MSDEVTPQQNATRRKASVMIEEFAAHFRTGITAWEEAGRVLVEGVDKDINFKSKLRAAHPEISVDMIDTFERIGRKQLYAPILTETCVAARLLMELPYEVQEQFHKTPIPVLICSKNGKLVTEDKYLHQISRKEARQVFRGSVLTPEQQVFTLLEPDEETDVAESAEPPSTLEKPVHIGYFKLQHAADGTISVTPCDPSDGAQYVRVIPTDSEGKGFQSTVLLFYRSKY